MDPYILIGFTILILIIAKLLGENMALEKHIYKLHEEIAELKVKELKRAIKCNILAKIEAGINPND